MITLTEGNLYGFIRWTKTEEELAIKRCLTFVKEAKKYARFPIITTTRLYQKREGVILIFRGIVGEFVNMMDKDEELAVTVISERDEWEKPTEENRAKAIAHLRPYQVEAFDAAIAAGGGIQWLATNAGKTEVAGAVTNAYPHKKFLYLVRTKELLDQTLERLRTKMGVDCGELSTVRCDLDHHVVVAMAQTLHSRRDSFVEYLMGIDAVIADECQHFGGETSKGIFSRCTSALFHMGLTGTVPSDRVARLCIEQFFGPVSYRVPNQFLIDNEYSSPINITMVVGDWGHTGVGVEIRRLVTLESLGAGGINLFHEASLLGILRNPERNEAIHQVVQSIIESGGTGVLVFVDYIEHGKILEELIEYPFVSAGSLERDAIFKGFKDGTIPCIISSPILDEGIDVSRIHHIVLASGKKSSIKLLQRIGRGLRKEEGKVLLNYYDFYDDETGMFKKHSEKRIEIYKQEGFPVQKRLLEEITSIPSTS